jgi:hypothetical protein
MAVIRYKKSILNIKRIVAYGCSYTHGSELADDDFIENANELKKKMGLMDFNNKYAHMLAQPELVATQQSRAWPALLSKRIKADCINRAAGGTSLENTLMRIRQDLTNKELKKDDLVVVGITTMSRWQTINNKGYLEQLMPYVMDSKNSMHHAMLQVYTDVKLYETHLTHLEQISFELDQAGIPFLGFPMIEEMLPMYDKIMEEIKDPEFRQIIKWRTKRLQSNFHYKWNLALGRYGSEDKQLGGLHWNQEVHKDFAKAIAAEIKI